MDLTKCWYCSSCRYTVDSVRRVATETVLPHLMHKWEGVSAAGEIISQRSGEGTDSSESKKRKKKGKKGGSKETRASANMDQAASSEAVTKELPEGVAKQFILDEYDNFDDFLEMVISFG